MCNYKHCEYLLQIGPTYTTTNICTLSGSYSYKNKRFSLLLLITCGPEGSRTLDLLIANEAFQPAELQAQNVVGVPRIELGTSVLSGLCSNQLSYTPIPI